MRAGRVIEYRERPKTHPVRQSTSTNSVVLLRCLFIRWFRDCRPNYVALCVRLIAMLTGPKPPIQPPCTRWEWHCENCGGDSIFDIELKKQPRPDPLECLGCSHSLPVYLDIGVVRRYFRAHGASEWQPK